jgi:hypothetical protein
MTAKIETPGTIRAAAEDDCFQSLGSSEHAHHDRLVHFSAFLKGAVWQRERDIEIIFGLCDNDKGNEVADEIRAQAVAIDEVKNGDG